MNIRYAKESDLPNILVLYKDLFGHMNELQPEHFVASEQDRSFVFKAIENEEFKIFVAEENTNILGFALFQEKESPDYNCLVKRKFVYLMDLAVSPVARNKGVATNLIEKVKEFTLDRGYDYLELNVLSNNYNAIKLYEKQDFQIMNHSMGVFLK